MTLGAKKQSWQVTTTTTNCTIISPQWVSQMSQSQTAHEYSTVGLSIDGLSRHSDLSSYRPASYMSRTHTHT